MINNNIVQRQEIPESLIGEMVERLKNFTIGFYYRKTTESGNEPFLIGTGTLVSCGGKYAILTAHHVIQELPQTGRLGVIIDSNQTTESLDINGLHYIPLARGSVDSTGPDIGLILMSEIIAATIGAKKSFFNLDPKIEKFSTGDINFSDEMWLSQGFIDERTSTREAPERNCMARQFYNLCGLGQPNRHYFEGEFDYVEFPYQIGIGADCRVPSSFGGTSGGAFWQIPLFKNQAGLVSFGSPSLRGVIFYQEFQDDNSGILRGHGPKTIYGIIPGVICGPRP